MFMLAGYLFAGLVFAAISLGILTLPIFSLILFTADAVCSLSATFTGLFPSNSCSSCSAGYGGTSCALSLKEGILVPVEGEASEDIGGPGGFCRTFCGRIDKLRWVGRD